VNLAILLLLFFLIALIYASVGFGGGSSYLALLAQPIFMLTPAEIRPAALLCNIVVVTGGVLIFYREKKIVWKEVWPFLVASIPLAYLGGLIQLNDDVFYLVLSITLILAAVALWIQPSNAAPTEKSNNNFLNVAIGGGIGFLSGLVSIGGGIFLSPLLHLIRWAEAKKISALASLFILVNSVGGLAGQVSAGIPDIELSFIVPLLLSVFVGGQIGSRLGSRKLNPTYIKRITAVLILVAGVNILRDHL
jgi:uncharacterized membrane protein YfcA